MAPKFWQVKRKGFPFILSANPGPYAKDKCYPIGIILRDVLNVCNSLHEAKMVMNSGFIQIDGITRRDVHFGVGIMDVINIIPNGESYRLIPKDLNVLIPIKTKEKDVKLLKITSKVSIKGSKLQYGFHDGKTLISEQALRVGDTCLLELPEAKIKDHVKFDKGCTVFIVKGENAGKVGMVEDIRDGIFSLPKRALVTIGDRAVELPVEMVMAVGADKPVIKVN